MADAIDHSHTVLYGVSLECEFHSTEYTNLCRASTAPGEMPETQRFGVCRQRERELQIGMHVRSFRWGRDDPHDVTRQL